MTCLIAAIPFKPCHTTPRQGISAEPQALGYTSPIELHAATLLLLTDTAPTEAGRSLTLQP